MWSSALRRVTAITLHLEDEVAILLHLEEVITLLHLGEEVAIPLHLDTDVIITLGDHPPASSLRMSDSRDEG